MSNADRYTCKVWQGSYEIIPHNAVHQLMCFYVEIKVCRLLELPNNEHKVLNTFKKSYFVSRRAVLLDEMETLLRARLVLARLPRDIEDAVIKQVINFGHNMVNNPRNDHRKILPMVVGVWIGTQPDEESRDEATTPKSSIEALQNLALDVCVICLEKLSVGPKIRVMPCSHIFHGDCIDEWLMTSKSCPLCRIYVRN